MVVRGLVRGDFEVGLPDDQLTSTRGSRSNKQYGRPPHSRLARWQAAPRLRPRCRGCDGRHDGLARGKPSAHKYKPCGRSRCRWARDLVASSTCSRDDLLDVDPVGPGALARSTSRPLTYVNSLPTREISNRIKGRDRLSRTEGRQVPGLFARRLWAITLAHQDLIANLAREHSACPLLRRRRALPQCTGPLARDDSSSG